MHIIPMEMFCGNNFYGSGPSSCLKSQGSLQTLAWRPCSTRQLWGTYPTPPYLTLRENFEKKILLKGHQRQLLDPKQRLFVPDRFEYDAQKKILTNEAEFKPGSSPTKWSMSDLELKWLTTENGTLEAIAQPEFKGGVFEITIYKSSSLGMRSGSNKIPVVIKVAKNESYLSCPATNPELRLERIPPNNLDSISGDLKRFIFWKIRSGNSYKFESEANKDFYMATSKDNDKVKMVKGQTQNANLEFNLYVEEQSTVFLQMILF